jgi:hypothetical protein
MNDESRKYVINAIQEDLERIRSGPDASSGQSAATKYLPDLEELERLRSHLEEFEEMKSRGLEAVREWATKEAWLKDKQSVSTQKKASKRATAIARKGE